MGRCGWWQKRREAGSGRGWEEQIPKNDYEAKLFNKEESFRKSKNPDFHQGKEVFGTRNIDRLYRVSLSLKVFVKKLCLFLTI